MIGAKYPYHQYLADRGKRLSGEVAIDLDSLNWARLVEASYAWAMLVITLGKAEM